MRVAYAHIYSLQQSSDQKSRVKLENEDAIKNIIVTQTTISKWITCKDLTWTLNVGLFYPS